MRTAHSHVGFASSHFFFRLRQVMQPVLERPVAFLCASAAAASCGFLGRPRLRLMRWSVFSFGVAGSAMDDGVWRTVGLVGVE